MSTSESIPTSIDVRRDAGELRITWADGTVQSLSLRDIRRACPCAECADETRRAEQEGGLHMLTGREETASENVVDVSPVGRYAIQILWDDGHNTGIYTFGRLRQLGERRDS